MNCNETIFSDDILTNLVVENLDKFSIYYLYCQNNDKFVKKVCKFMRKICGEIDENNPVDKDKFDILMKNYQNLYEKYFYLKSEKK